MDRQKLFIEGGWETLFYYFLWAPEPPVITPTRTKHCNYVSALCCTCAKLQTTLLLRDGSRQPACTEHIPGARLSQCPYSTPAGQGFTLLCEILFSPIISHPKKMAILEEGIIGLVIGRKQCQWNVCDTSKITSWLNDCLLWKSAFLF